MIRYSTSRDQVMDWDEAAEVILRAPLGVQKRDPEKLKRAFLASHAVVYAFDDGRLIGTARALSDGEYQAAVYDVVLLPEYHGKGIGKELMKRLCDQLPRYNIMLLSVPGREGFYKKLGFKKTKTAMAVLNPVMADPESGYLE